MIIKCCDCKKIMTKDGKSFYCENCDYYMYLCKKCQDEGNIKILYDDGDLNFCKSCKYAFCWNTCINKYQELLEEHFEKLQKEHLGKMCMKKHVCNDCFTKLTGIEICDKTEKSSLKIPPIAYKIQ